MTASSTLALRQTLAGRANEVSVDQSTGEQLFAVVDTLANNVRLRRSLANPSVASARRIELARQLFAGKLSEPAMAIVEIAVGLDWSNGPELMSALENEGVRSVFKAADVDQVSEELFRFGRMVAGDARLASTLTAEVIGLEQRRGLVAQLLDGRATAATVSLAQRAVSDVRVHDGETPNPEKLIERFLDVAATLRQRTAAIATVATPLSEQQRARLVHELERIYGRAIDLRVDVDPSVVGGVRVQIGDEIIDGSVESKLGDVRQQLKHSSNKA